MRTPPITAAALRRLRQDLGAPLRFGEKGKRPGDFVSFKDDPLGFITDVLGADPWVKQLEIITAVRTNRLCAIKACHSSGKDHVAARLMLWWVYAVGGRVICSAPTQHQLNDIIFDGELKRAFNWSPTPLFGNLYASSLWLDGEDWAGIHGLVSSKEARLTGLHAPRTLVVLTESNGIEDHAYLDLISNAVTEDDRIVALGNPLASTTGWYRRAFQQNSGWKQLTISADDVFTAGINVEGGKRVDGMITPAFVEQLRREYGERSPIYIAKVLAEFPGEGLERSITTRALLDASAKRYGAGITRGPWGIGFDIGRDGDPSALCWHQGEFFHGVEKIQTPTGGDAADAIQHKANELASDPFGLGRWPVNSITVDAVGIGASAVDVLTDRNITHVEFKGNEKAIDEHYLNKRAEAFGILSKKLAKGEIHIKYDEELWEELLALTWFTNERGRIQMVDKKDVRKLLGRSPNKADALAMAVYAMETGASIGGTLMSF